MPRYVCLFLILLLTNAATALLWPDAALAQSARQASPHEELIQTAVVEFDHGNFAEARELFRKAHALEPTARTFRALGLVEFELRNYSEAASMLEQALASSVKPLSAKQRAETEKLLERTRGYIGSLHIVTEPSHALVMADGAMLELGPERTLVLEVGEHVLEFQADGYLPVRKKVSVRGGQSETIQVTLRSALDPTHVAAAASMEQGAEVQRSNAPAPRADKPLRKKWWVWTVTGVVLAGAAATAAVLLTRDAESKLVALESPNTPPGGAIHTLLSAQQP